MEIKFSFKTILYIILIVLTVVSAFFIVSNIKEFVKPKENNSIADNKVELPENINQTPPPNNTDDNVSEDGGGNGTDGNDSVVHSENHKQF